MHQIDNIINQYTIMERMDIQKAAKFGVKCQIIRRAMPNESTVLMFIVLDM